jgi:F420-dependent oxidoreductase-like protein
MSPARTPDTLGVMRFGTFLPQGWRLDLAGIDPAEQWPTMSRFAQRIDAGAWDSIWVYDHFHTTPVPTEEATHEAWALMSALAATTSRVRLGQMCTCISYRNPAYLAKVAATVDGISAGRLNMGIGAGWYEHEWRAYGYGFPSAGERLARLDEGVQIMRQMWTTGTGSLQGKHYQVDGARCWPLPLQEGGIPLWVAGGGEKKTLRIAAQYASYTNFDPTPEAFRRKSEILEQHCKDVGRDFSEITRTADYNVVIGSTEADVRDRIEWIRSHYAPLVPADRLESTLRNYTDSPLVGTPDQIITRLKEAEALGLGYAITYFPDVAYDTSSIELFEREVMPALADG